MPPRRILPGNILYIILVHLPDFMEHIVEHRAELQRVEVEANKQTHNV